MPETSSQTQGTAGRHMLVTAGLLLVLTILAGLFLEIFNTRPANRIAPPRRDYPSEILQAEVTPDKVGSATQAILDHGPRFPGTAGHLGIQDFLTERLETLGWEVTTIDDTAVAPVTRKRNLEVMNPDTGAFSAQSGLEVFPFYPNHMQPVVTPGDGLVGRLVLVSRETVETGTSFEGAIALVDTSDRWTREQLGYDWGTYAALGFAAVIVSHPDGLDRVDWRAVAENGGMLGAYPVNFVRLAATPDIFDRVNDTIRLDVRVDYEATPTRVVIGRLTAAQPAREALVLLNAYDTPSPVPDLSPGGIHALNTAYVLRLAEGLTAYRESLRRDVMVLFYGNRTIGEESIRNLVRFLGLATTPTPGIGPEAAQEELLEKRKRPFLARRDENTRRLGELEAVRALFADPGFLVQTAPTRDGLAQLTPDQRAFFDDQFAHILRTVVMERREPYLQARIAVERAQVREPDHPLLRTFTAARQPFEESRSASGFSPLNLLESKPDYALAVGLRGRAEQRFSRLEAFHRKDNRWIDQWFGFAARMSAYREFGFSEFSLAPSRSDSDSAEILGLNTGREIVQVDAYEILNLASLSRAALGMESSDLEIPDMIPAQRNVASRHHGGLLLWSDRIISNHGFPIYRFYNEGRVASQRDRFNPTLLPWMRDMDSMRQSFAVTAETVLALAHGNGSLKTYPPYTVAANTFGGNLLASNIGATVVPDYSLEGALVGGPPGMARDIGFGHARFPFTLSDPYGRFWRPLETGDFANFSTVWGKGESISLLAAWIGPDGLIQYIKDEGEEAQRMFQSADIYWRDFEGRSNSTYILFRAAPVTILDTVDPQNLREFKAVKFLEARGLALPRKQWRAESSIPSMETAFLEPDQRFSVLLQTGTIESEDILETRSFLLGLDSSDPAGGEVGPGYLVADTPFVRFTAEQAAESMLAVNQGRIDLQRRYHMTDALTEDTHRSAQTYREAMQREAPQVERIRDARQSVAYSMVTHPVLKRSLWEAVLGILWYLGLLVPFIFFFEKLVFGFPDARRQIAAQAVIFLVVFGLLRLLHPAFLMVRSSLMILIGFIILLITVGMTLLFSGKFSENLEELQRRRGKLGGTEANTLAVMGTAFLLGLNNMHRRRLRTGLTCATLTLLTFVMIAFTSIQSAMVDEVRPIGAAPYQGILLKKEDFDRFSPAEIRATRQKFGDRYRVYSRAAILGTEDGISRLPRLPEVELVHRLEDPAGRPDPTVSLDSVLFLDAADPVGRNLEWIGEPWWFSEDAKTTDGPPAILVPDTVADSLGLSAADIAEGQNRVTLGGRDYAIRGIFRADSLNAYRDLDRYDVLPFDIVSLGSYQRISPSHILAPPDSPRVDASRLVIAENVPSPLSFHGGVRADLALVVDMEDAELADALSSIRGHMEQTGATIHYGLQDTAYQGKRTRERSLVGLLDMLIPLLLGGMVVLNTMKGSVYERRGEIQVYNSVGIAPKFIFIIFIAEALVYAVVGAVLGYLLSQATGRVLTEIGVTGGMNMTYASLTTIYASLTIMVAVFLSTLYPARQAMKIASPAEESGWSVPEPEGDRIEFDLPFNFRHHGRLAVLEFVHRLMEDHGEGGAGRFHASPPQLVFDDPSAEEPWPELRCRVWIKPYDLGVSQDVRISMRPDPTTELFKAVLILQRVSGTRDAWVNLNRVFIGRLRQHFLHWRAVGESDRQDLFQAAREKLETSLQV